MTPSTNPSFVSKVESETRFKEWFSSCSLEDKHSAEFGLSLLQTMHSIKQKAEKDTKLLGEGGACNKPMAHFQRA